MEYIISLVWNALELFGLMLVCKTFLPQRRNNWTTAAFFFVATLANLIISNLDIPIFTIVPVFQRFILLIICLCTSLIAYYGAWYKHVVIVAIFYFFIGAIDTLMVYGTCLVLNIKASELIWKKWLYTMIVSIGKSLFLFLSWLLFHLHVSKNTYNTNGKRVILTAIFPVVSVIMLYTVYDGYKAKDDLSINAVAFSLFLLVANAAIIYLMGSLAKAAHAEQEIIILNQSMALQTENYKALEKSYRAQRTATHEFKHQLQVINDLLDNKEYIEAKEYIGQLQVSQTSRIFVANTNHAIIDAILNEKYHIAIENGIDIHYKLNDLSQLPFRTDAIVVLLSNLLENAIEACLRLPDHRAIECTILLEKGLFLSIRNTSLPVSMKNGEIETIKEPKLEHGFGLAGVQHVLKELHGEYAMDYSKNWFQFVAEIPLS